MNYVKAAEELKMSRPGVYKRLMSPEWPDWHVLSPEECDKMFPHYKGINMGTNHLPLLQRLKNSKPFWYEGRLYLSLVQASAQLNKSLSFFTDRLKAGKAKYAPIEQAKEYILKGYFDDVPSLDNPPPRV